MPIDRPSLSTHRDPSTVPAHSHSRCLSRAMAQSPDNLSASATLYCAEDAAAWDDDSGDEWAPPSPPPPPPIHPVLPPPPGAMALLVAVEAEHVPRADYLTRLHSRTLDATARHDAVSWIFKVNELYRFRPVTAYLSVNYLDRFLSSNTLPEQGHHERTGGGGGWPMQLLSVACVSVAAKLEETRVPLLLDLQVLDPGYVFEPRTVRRMELLLMAALRWRMLAVTPFDFLDLLSVALPRASRRSVRARSAELILSTRRVVEFLGYPPSVIAAAAVLCAVAEIDLLAAVDYGDLLASFADLVNKEALCGCRQLMEMYLIDTCPSVALSKSRGEPLAPLSPVGVLDAAACGSCDTQKAASEAEPSRAAPPPPPPPSKRRRLGDGRCTASIDTGDDDNTE